MLDNKRLTSAVQYNRKCQLTKQKCLKYSKLTLRLETTSTQDFQCIIAVLKLGNLEIEFKRERDKDRETERERV